MDITVECKDCKKDWTKCGTCSVCMNWVKEQKNKRISAEESEGINNEH